MKRNAAKPSDAGMRFFTPELFLRFNSERDDEADAADATWEDALNAYGRHLDELRVKLPADVRQLSELCLHDAELQPADDSARPTDPLVGQASPQARLLLVAWRQAGRLTALAYLLSGRVRLLPAPADWPFSTERVHWLYDELDVRDGRRRGYEHRILLSDGRVLQIPFTAVQAHVAPLAPAAEATRHTA